MPIGRQVLTGKPRLAAGARSRLVTIEQLTQPDAAGTSGRPVQTWTTLRTQWFSRLDVRADERFASSQSTASVETQWHGEYTADMDPEVVDVPKTRRLRYEGRVYDILSASRLEDKRGIELMTLAQVSNA